MIVDMKEIEAFFFEAMLQGWVNPNTQAQPVAGMPGYKGYEYKKNGLYLRDIFIANPGTRKSAGSTTILQDDIPVWMMAYGGVYPPEVIPFLKRVLTHAYQSKTFKGGRGLDTSEPIETGEYWFYQNTLTPAERLNSFTRFKGFETISRNPIVLEDNAYHYYFGLSLV
ncbi:MAG: hypothetical protein WCV85_01230 [Patescibacteria group bacterium]|jgi:hypothetical protein